MHPEFEAILTHNQLRLTQPRRKVFMTLHDSDEPLSASAIAKQCAGVDRVSVYRTLELFTTLNIATVVPVGWKRRYELTSPFKPHHHHLSCTNCGALIDVHSGKLEQLVASIAAEYGFAATEHKFEVSGLCATCRQTDTKISPNGP